MNISSKMDFLELTVKQKSAQDSSLWYPAFPAEAFRWQPTHGTKWYDMAIKHHNGLLVMSNSKREEMGIHLIYSGQVLDAIRETVETDGWDILQYHVGAGHKVTRLDIAVDIKDAEFDVEDFKRAFYDGNCTTRARDGDYKDKPSGAKTLYVGSTKRRKKLGRVYDKAKDLDQSGWWLRAEYEIHQRSARAAAENLVESSDKHEQCVSLIRGFMDFPTIPLWNEALSAPPVKIDVPAHVQGNTEKWLLKQVAPALAREMLHNPEMLQRFWDAIMLNLDKLTD